MRIARANEPGLLVLFRVALSCRGSGGFASRAVGALLCAASCRSSSRVGVVGLLLGACRVVSPVVLGRGLWGVLVAVSFRLSSWVGGCGVVPGGRRVACCPGLMWAVAGCRGWPYAVSR